MGTTQLWMVTYDGFSCDAEFYITGGLCFCPANCELLFCGVCVCCPHVSVCTPMCTSVDNHRCHLYLFLFERNFHSGLDLRSKQDWVAMDPEGSAYRCFPSARSANTPICPASLCGFWRLNSSLRHTLLIELSLFSASLLWFREQDHSLILERKPQAGSSFQTHTHFYPACLLASTWPTVTASAGFTNCTIPQCPTWFSKAASSSCPFLYQKNPVASPWQHYCSYLMKSKFAVLVLKAKWDRTFLHCLTARFSDVTSRCSLTQRVTINPTHQFIPTCFDPWLHL